jgi:hypothetical protein
VLRAFPTEHKYTALARRPWLYTAQRIMNIRLTARLLGVYLGAPDLAGQRLDDLSERLLADETTTAGEALFIVRQFRLNERLQLRGVADGVLADLNALKSGITQPVEVPLLADGARPGWARRPSNVRGESVLFRSLPRLDSQVAVDHANPPVVELPAQQDLSDIVARDAVAEVLRLAALHD